MSLRFGSDVALPSKVASERASALFPALICSVIRFRSAWSRSACEGSPAEDSLALPRRRLHSPLAASLDATQRLRNLMV